MQLTLANAFKIGLRPPIELFRLPHHALAERHRDEHGLDGRHVLVKGQLTVNGANQLRQHGSQFRAKQMDLLDARSSPCWRIFLRQDLIGDGDQHRLGNRRVRAAAKLPFRLGDPVPEPIAAPDHRQLAIEHDVNERPDGAART